MNYDNIKKKAREKLKGNLWEFWKPYLIIMVISFIFNKSIGGIYEMESANGKLLDSIYNIILLPASVGMIAYILNFIRGKDYNLSILYKYYKNFFVILFIGISVFVLCSIGFICLIIPGFILLHCFIFVFYIFVDNDTINCMDCLKKSYEFTKGYKADIFFFNLSFIGWILSCILIIPLIWVIPYILTSIAIYYDELKKKREEKIIKNVS